MKAIVIYENSIVANVARTAVSEIARLNRVAWKKPVFISFYHDKVRVQARNTRTRKVPHTAITSSESFIKWLEILIQKSWQ